MKYGIRENLKNGGKDLGGGGETTPFNFASFERGLRDHSRRRDAVVDAL